MLQPPLISVQKAIYLRMKKECRSNWLNQYAINKLKGRSVICNIWCWLKVTQNRMYTIKNSGNLLELVACKTCDFG
jgi:hypothetical protein